MEWTLLDQPIPKTDGSYTLELEEDELQVLILVIQSYFKERKLEDSPQIDKMLGVFRKIEKIMLDRSFTDRVAESSEHINDENYQRPFIYRS